MDKNRKTLLLCLAVPLGVGALASLLAGGYTLFASVEKPPLSPPGWVFPVVWTVLYLMMGYASCLVALSGRDRADVRRALGLYAAQLAVNFVWPLLFFGGQLYLAALICLAVLWVLILMTIRAFSRIREKAGDLLIPYLVWVSFAAYLNFGIFLLN